MRGQLVEQADSLGQGVVGLAAGLAADMVIDGLLEMLETYADQATQAFAEDDLILQVQRLAAHMLEEIGAGGQARRFRLAVDRVVDIDGIVAAGAGGDALVLAVVLVLAADQQLMLPAAKVETAAQFQLADAVVPRGRARDSGG